MGHYISSQAGVRGPRRVALQQKFSGEAGVVQYAPVLSRDFRNQRYFTHRQIVAAERRVYQSAVLPADRRLFSMPPVFYGAQSETKGVRPPI